MLGEKQQKLMRSNGRGPFLETVSSNAYKTALKTKEHGRMIPWCIVVDSIYTRKEFLE